MAKQDKRKHHKQPRHFLNGFAAPLTNPYQKVCDIWVYTKGEAFKDGFNPRLESIADVAYENDFYAFTKEDMTVDYNTYEDILMRDFEQPGQPILDKIRKREQVTEKDKHMLSRYVGSMITRGDWWRDVGEQALEDSVRKISDAILNQIPDKIKKQGVKEIIDRQAEKLKSGEEVKSGIIRQAIRVSEIFEMMVWRFIVPRNGLFFFTSDKPVFYYYLDRPESELVFPLSSEVTLSLSWQDRLPRGNRWNHISGNWWEADDATVEHVRGIVASEAHREVYACKKAEWLQRFINNRQN